MLEHCQLIAPVTRGRIGGGGWGGGGGGGAGEPGWRRGESTRLPYVARARKVPSRVVGLSDL